MRTHGTRGLCLSWALFGLAVAACGGAGGASSGGQAAPGSAGSRTRDAGATSPEPSIGDIAARQGGFFSRDTSQDNDSPPLASSLRAHLVEGGKKPKLDGVPREWPNLVAATSASTPSNGQAMAIGVEYDDANLYVAASVTDPNPGAEDHASLVLAIPFAGGQLAAYEVAFIAGKPGERAGAVRFTAGAKKGTDVTGARIVEAPQSSGYTFEALIPWSAFDEARTVRVGLRGIGRFYASGGAVVLATGGGDAEHPRSLPALPTEPEQALIDGFLHPRGLDVQSPKADVYADVAGDSMKERVAVFGNFLTICGHDYRGGKEFFFRDLRGELVRLESRDIFGRGKESLFVRRRLPIAGTVREWFEIWHVADNGEPVTLFAHEIAVTKGNQRISNAVQVSNKTIEIVTEPATGGWDEASYHEATDTDVAPVLLPWGKLRSETFRLENGKFAKVAETPNPAATTAQQNGGNNTASTSATASTGAAVASPRQQAEPSTPPQGKGGDLGKLLLEQYRKDHGVAADVAPKADLQVHVADDARPERVVLLQRDLVVFGPGFKDGRAYSFTTLAEFADPADIKDLTARDLTGDGAADLVVRGVRHVIPQASPAGSGGSGGGNAPAPLELEAMFVYAVEQGTITRIFGIETAREQSGKRVQGLVQFVPARGGKTFDIDVRPGRATGWTEKTYPWAQDQPGSGSIEPLLLPWGNIPSLRYAWNGKEFARTP